MPYAQPLLAKTVLCSVLSDMTLVAMNREQRFLRSCLLMGREYFQEGIENVRQIGLVITPDS